MNFRSYKRSHEPEKQFRIVYVSNHSEAQAMARNMGLGHDEWRYAPTEEQLLGLNPKDLRKHQFINQNCDYDYLVANGWMV